ncbi:MAG: hypothetical protein B7Z80_04240 [Rhodospirillales bacterium 20-64-7]|nr:MAG: hypothetical protein B7Z80_04240 [Rhodospirillales bacterium 20-64-7]HQT76079.1 DUF2189 domain-containing protein [Rhodopila sp.]
MINNPPGWSLNMLTAAYQAIRPAPSRYGERARTEPIVGRIGMRDLRWALARGMEDFAAVRTDVISLCVLYPLLGLLLAKLASGNDLLPLVFPLASGFALIGPVAAVGLNEMSRRREAGLHTTWADAFAVVRSPSIGGIVLLSLILMMLLLFWLVLSNVVYVHTLGPKPPVSASHFVHDIFTTPAGAAMAIVGIAVGFVCAAVALTISAVSFPLLLDREASLETAVRTSARVVARNPVTMAAWGLIVAGLLVLGSIPALLGLIFVLPVLGHATWHLYRRAVT